MLGRIFSRHSVSPVNGTAGSAGIAAGSERNSKTPINKKQAYEHSKPGSIWHALSFNDENNDEHYEAFCDMVEDGHAETSKYPDSTCKCKFKRDAAGGTVLHIALLNKKYKFANYLIDKYSPPSAPGELVELGYCKNGDPDAHDPEPLYTGETALHIAIVNCSRAEMRKLEEEERNIRMAMVKRLLELAPSLLESPTSGAFFSIAANRCYYGEYPILFACSTGNIETVELLIESNPKKDQILYDTVDKEGNGPLHMAVHHSLHEMYSFLYDKLVKSIDEDPEVAVSQEDLTDEAWQMAEERRRALMQERILRRNREGQTPLAYAVRLENEMMFLEACSKKQVVMWEFGPVTCFKMPLEEFDTVGEKGESCVRHSVIGIATALGHTDILKHEFVYDQLQHKWRKFARMQWIVSGLGYMVLMLVLTVMIADLRTGGRFGGRAIMPCYTVLGYSKGEIADTLIADECSAAGTVVGVKPYADITPYRTALEIILFIGTMCFAALEIYDIWAWFCLEWRFYTDCCGDDHRTPDDVRSTKGSSTDGRETNVSLLERDRSEGIKNQTVGMGKFIGFVMLEVAWVYFGWAMSASGRLVKLKERSPLSQQRMDVVSSLLLWGFSFVVIFHFILFVTGIEPWDNYTPNVELSMAALVGWPHLLNYALGFKELGYLVITICEMLVRDVMRFIIIFIVLSVAYAEAFYIFQIEEYQADDGKAACAFCSIMDSWFTLWRFLLGDFDYVYYSHNHQSPNWVAFLFLTYSVLTNILLLNLLIALMNSTYEGVAQRAEEVWLQRFARFIIQAELRLPRIMRNDRRLGRTPHNKDDVDDSDLSEIYESVQTDDETKGSIQDEEGAGSKGNHVSGGHGKFSFREAVSRRKSRAPADVPAGRKPPLRAHTMAIHPARNRRRKSKFDIGS